VPSPFTSELHLQEVIKTAVAAFGSSISPLKPLADLRLPDGSRMNVVLSPISVKGSLMTIRKFSAAPLTFADLLKFGSINQTMIDFLEACVKGRRNMVISGGTGSGKTTVMNMICDFIEDGERIITVENACELRLRQSRVVSLESRAANAEGLGEVSMRDLVINALRMRPDRLLVGEVRGGEVIDVLQAMNTGYDGSMITIHANSPRDVLARLEAMATMSTLSIPLLTIRQQLSSAIDLITYQERLPEGSRKIIKISEVVGMRGDSIEVQDIFEFRRTGTENGRITGKFVATGYIPSFLRELHELGLSLPMSMFTPE
jgi:pilus assembly protein CpaF